MRFHCPPPPLALLSILALLTAAAPPPVAAQGVETSASAIEPQYGLRLPEIRLHDPFIHADASSKTYYLYSSASANQTGQGRPGTLYYKSKDLAAWDGPYIAFVVPQGSWAHPQERPWAPEMHAYRGKYYLFTTLHNSEQTLPTPRPDRPNVMRSTIIAVSDSPEGPFTLIKKDSPLTPRDFMTLDGTLYVDQSGEPWMVYAHEWIQKADGTIEAIPLKADLSAAAGDPIHLFKGSDAPWINDQAIPNAKESIYVTDGPQLYRTENGTLLMLWCSYEKNRFNRDGYVQTVARSRSGKLTYINRAFSCAFCRPFAFGKTPRTLGAAPSAGAKRQRARHAISHFRGPAHAGRPPALRQCPRQAVRGRGSR